MISSKNHIMKKNYENDAFVYKYNIVENMLQYIFFNTKKKLYIDIPHFYDALLKGESEINSTRK
jgi:hypothetical protein